MSSILRFVPGFNSKFNNTNAYDSDRHFAPEDHLISALMTEFINSATFTIAVTSLVTAKRQSKSVCVVGAVAGYFPSEPLIFPAVTAGMIAVTGHNHLIENLHNYYSRVSFARSVTDLPETTWLSNDKMQFGGWSDIAEVWTRACAAAILVVHCSHDTNFGTDPVKNCQVNTIHQLLKSAKDGQSPCVRSDGRLFVPGWLDQRRHERTVIGFKVIIEAAGVRSHATLHDISVGGMGIVSCPSLPIGAQISVQLVDGRVLTGIVTWSGDQRLGARFIQQLSPSDPLLTTR